MLMNDDWLKAKQNFALKRRAVKNISEQILGFIDILSEQLPYVFNENTEDGKINLKIIIDAINELDYVTLKNIKETYQTKVMVALQERNNTEI